MKAIVYEKYGPPEVLQLKEVPQPVPQADEVLVKVHMASANTLDWRAMRGDPYIFRLQFGFPRPNHPILGADVAGTVEVVGSEVTQVKPGDAVFGDVAVGGFAEYVAAPADRLATIPANVSFEQAAGVPIAAFTALQGLRDFGHIKAGQKVLVNGSSGAVGTFAVQIAKAFGAEVTGVCSTRNLEQTLSIGAVHAIDYTQQDFTKTGEAYDLIYCAVANRSAADYKRALKPDGVCVVAGYKNMVHMIIQLMLLGGKQVGSMGSAYSDPEDLLVLRDLLETGKIVSVIDRRYPLSETAEAIRYLETGHARAKVMITVIPD